MLSVRLNGLNVCNNVNRLLLIILLTPLSLLAIETSNVVAPIVKTERLEPLSASNLFQIVLMLLLVIGLILATAWLMRRSRSMGFGSPSVIRYLGGISVGQRERIVLIEVGKTQLLVGVAPGSVQTIHKLDERIEIDSAKSGLSSFTESLQQALKKGRESR